MLFKIRSDYHCGAPNALITIEELMHVPLGTYFLGDIIDLANCRKSDVPKLQSFLEDFMVKNHHATYVMGNHERYPVWYKSHIIEKLDNGRGYVYITHGDLEANFDKWSKYRQKPKGAGFIKRKLWVPLVEEFESIYDRGFRQGFLDRAAAVAIQNDCAYYICGHFHPKKTEMIRHKGITIIIVPRGYTEIYI